MEQVIQNALISIVTAISGLAVAYLTLYIAKAKAKVEAEVDKIKDDKQKALIDSAIARVNDLTQKAVDSAQQTIVSDLKAQIAKGSASKEDLLAIGKNVASIVYGQLNADTINVLKLEVNDVQGYIVDSVEAQVLALKGNLAVPNFVPQSINFSAPIEAQPVVQPEVVAPVETPVQ